MDKRGPHPQPDSSPQLSRGAALAGVISSILKVGKLEAQLENQALDGGCRAPFLRALPSPLWPPQGPDCELSLSWDSGPRGELALGSSVRGGEQGPPHGSCGVCLSTSLWAPVTAGPGPCGQPESKATYPGWLETGWETWPTAGHLVAP